MEEQMSRWVHVFAIVVFAATPAAAQDAAFQSFFFDVCQGSPTGELAVRCGETPGSSGDLSGDSESSLNPGQLVAAQEGTLNRARDRSRRLEERIDERREAERGGGQQAKAGGIQTFGGVASGRGVWFSRDGSSRTTNPAGIGVGERGFDGTSAGLQLGADMQPVQGLLVGALFSWIRTDLEFDEDSPGVNFNPQSAEGDQESDSFTFTLFGSYNITESLYVDAHVSGGYVDYDLKRTVVFQESGRSGQTNVNTRSETDGSEVSVGGRVGYDLDFGSASVGPYARVQYTRVEIEGDTEKGGAGLGMSFGDGTRTSVTTALGLNASYAWSAGFGVIVPQLRAEWEHEFERDAETVTTAYPLDQAGNRFRSRGDSPDRDFMNLGAGVALVLPGGWAPYADYQTLLFYKSWERHQMTAGVRKEF
jgi:outer membrane autotransporter protein